MSFMFFSLLTSLPFLACLIFPLLPWLGTHLTLQPANKTPRPIQHAAAESCEMSESVVQRPMWCLRVGSQIYWARNITCRNILSEDLLDKMSDSCSTASMSVSTLSFQRLFLKCQCTCYNACIFNARGYKCQMKC